MKKRTDRFSVLEYLIFSAVTFAVLCACVCLGSVNVPLTDTLTVTWQAVCALFQGKSQPTGLTAAIILSVRIPRVLCVAMTGAALSLAGAAMQGLLKNPLADGLPWAYPPVQHWGRSLPLHLASAFPFSPLQVPWSWQSCLHFFPC